MNLFDLAARITLDSSQYEKGLKGAGKLASSFGASIKKGLDIAAKASVTAIGSGAVAAIGIAKSAVQAYAEFEQLEGGVKKLFGEDTAKTVIANARNAFSTAGMSANEYISNVTGFSAKLIHDLSGDTEEAARISDLALRDIADNANTFGKYTAQELATVYQSLARGQFQLLDNLSLGYSGSAAEMARLVNESGVMNGMFEATAENVKDIPFDLLIQAIHKVQEELNITGTTEAEASKTIEGSLNATKAAWQNLLLAFGSGKGVKEAMQNLTTNAKNFLRNVVPVAKSVLSGIGNFVRELAPVIARSIPELAQELIPSTLDAAVALVGTLSRALPGILKAVLLSVDGFIETLGAWIRAKAPALGEAFDGIADLWNSRLKPALESIKTFVAETLAPKIKEAFSQNIQPVLEAARASAEKVSGWVATAAEKLASFVEWLTSGSDEADALIGVVLGLVAGLTAYSAVMTTVKTVTAAVQAAQMLLNAAMSANPIGLIIAAVAGLTAAFIYLWNKSEGFRKFWIDLWDTIKDKISSAVEKIKEIFNFEWSLPKLKMPHFSITDGPSVLGVTLPKISVDWYRKAYTNPYLFTKPTLMGFGDGNGGEMVYGHDRLMKDIREASGGGNTYNFTVNITGDISNPREKAEELMREIKGILAREGAAIA